MLKLWKGVKKVSNQSRWVSVTQLNRYVSALLENQKVLNNIYVKGELSNVKQYSSGHWYFNIKDQNAQVACVMFKGNASSLKFRMKDGLEVLLQAKVSLYEANGKYQLNVFSAEEVGKGNLHLAFEELKEKLKKEGLFDLNFKQALPKFPRTIGVVTSPSGAVIRDIIHVCHRRYPATKIILYPAKVQGPGSAESLVEGIQYFNNTQSVDILIVGRGGGSIEDLWSFNEEILARAAFHSKIPIISAVGHETDFTILDFVADHRAPTPSAAAELAVPDMYVLLSKIKADEEQMKRSIEQKLLFNKQRLSHLANNRYLVSPYERIHESMQSLDLQEEALTRLLNQQLESSKQRLSQLMVRLDGLSPLKILSRGYALVMDEEKKTMTSVKEISLDDTLTLYMRDGQVDCTVRDIKEKTYE